ncbi:glycerophosphocholine choline phosphodiesterase ENPP6-like [Dermacentor silvarum]|uniref:glycerophosphocholine choline phosphodiesterase ENPP6-like n=1 Tax=Dermacentor silvarum TaxID=543639 RepID=UPI002101BDE5|nr:glycerophosphocholine choline phosphodiesterase ENPP6-like [Dermacentor silvarum]
MARLRTAYRNRFTITHKNRPVGSTNLCSDLAMARSEEAIVLDGCFPFDNRPDAFSEACTAKTTKYEPPVTHGNELRSLERSKPSGSFQPVFRKKLIVFLADGLRWDYVDRADYPGFRLLEKLGVRAERLLPVFPSVSYPNWYSLATGLYTEDHGILGNYMYDAKTNSYFTMSSPESFHPRWWTRAEPLWTRALRRNRTVAMFWWDGCQVSINGTRPQSCTPYGGYSTEIDHLMNQRIGEAVNAFKTGRLDLAMFYYEGPDAEGHRNGPDSEGIEDAVRKVDRYLWNLQMGLQREGLLEEVNIVVVSDHGMTRTSPESTHHIDMDALVNERDVHIMLDKGPFAMLHPKPGREHEVLKSLLMKKPKGLNVFTKDNIPDEWHFRNNELVAPIVLLAQEGHYIMPAPTAVGGGGGGSTLVSIPIPVSVPLPLGQSGGGSQGGPIIITSPPPPAPPNPPMPPHPPAQRPGIAQVGGATDFCTISVARCSNYCVTALQIS